MAEEPVGKEQIIWDRVVVVLAGATISPLSRVKHMLSKLVETVLSESCGGQKVNVLSRMMQHYLNGKKKR